MRQMLLALVMASAWFHNGKITTPAAKLGVPPDTTPPETTLSGYPDVSTTDRTATFTFASDDPSATFECNLDSAGYSSCTSPKAYSGLLAFGSHSFLVRATDTAGNTDSSPASHSWTITFTNTKSVSFAGDDDIVKIGQPADLEFTPGTSHFSVSLWFKRGAAADYDRDMLSKATQGSSGTTDFLLRATSADTVQNFVYGGQNTAGGTTGGFVHGWHHVVSSVSGPTGKLYFDGHQVGSDFAVGILWTAAIDWLIGASRYDSNADTGYPFSGNIDEVSFWSTALTASGVTELFNSGDPAAVNLHSSSANLLHWYRMGDDDTYPSIHDEVGGVTGTCQNMASSANITTDVPAGLDPLSCVAASGCEQWVADDWDGSSSTWTARVGSNNGTKRSTPVLAYTPDFMGRKSIFFDTSGDCMTLPGDSITDTDKRTYELIVDDWGTGNNGKYVFARYDGGSNHSINNWLFKINATALESTLNDTNATLYLGQSSISYTNTDSKPVAWTLTMDLTVPRYTLYRNGTQIFQDTTSSGTLGTASNLALGLGCRWNQSAASIENFGGKVVEFLRHGVELPSGTVASRLTQFNSLKGY